MNEIMIIVGIEVLIVHIVLIALIRSAMLKIERKMRKNAILEQFEAEISRIASIKCREVEPCELEIL